MRIAVILAMLGCGRVGFDVIDTSCVGGHCYFLFDTPVLWTQARDACTALGPTTHLVTIADGAENQGAFRFAATIPFDPMMTTNHRSIMWLGGEDPTMTMSWSWITTEPFGYTNWRAGEPSSSNEHCLIMLGAETGLWDNRSCTALPFAYLCEQE